MKRDMDLIPTLLSVIESGTDPAQLRASDILIDGQDPEKIVAHVGMLDAAGFIKSRSITYVDNTPPEYIIFKLSWAGHEFLDAARNDSLWNKAKQRVSSVGGSVSLATMGEILGAVAKEALGLK